MGNVPFVKATALVIGGTAVLLHARLAKAREQDHSFVKTPSIDSRKDRFKALGVNPNQPLKAPMNEYFLNKDGLYIHFRRWIPQANVHPLPPKGIVVIVHGLGEYSSRYDHVARALNSAGFIVYGLDHQGHGRSEGDRLFVKSFDDYVDDVMAVVSIAKAENPLIASKTFMLAHSMGGLIGVTTLSRHQSEFAGAVLSGPLLALNPPVPPNAVGFIGWLSANFPKMRMAAMANDKMTKYLPIRDHYANDPLVCHNELPARMSFSIVSQVQKVMTEIAPKISLPYLLIHGKDDEICLPSSSEEFHRTTISASNQKRLELVDGMHETVNDNKEATVNLVVGWLKSRIST